VTADRAPSTRRFGTVPAGSMSMAAKAAALTGRCPGSLARPAMTVVRRGSGTYSGKAGAGRPTCAGAFETTDSPLKGREPVSSSYPTTASE